jgi:hypothetical protein
MKHIPVYNMSVLWVAVSVNGVDGKRLRNKMNMNVYKLLYDSELIRT